MSKKHRTFSPEFKLESAHSIDAETATIGRKITAESQ